MNKQFQIVNGVKVNTKIEWCDYTFNPVAGCHHGCRWTMPDGAVAECYAENVAEGVAQKAYPHGFDHHYWKPNLLEEPLRVTTPARIFVGSMADLFGAWVPEDQISQVLDVCRRAHWHTFILLTKNIPRALKFGFPSNVWVGVSSPPDQMHGKPLNQKQQIAMLRRSLGVLRQLRLRGVMTWLSAEPLSWDISPYLMDGAIDWCVIGAASDGRRQFPPSAEAFKNTLAKLDGLGVATFFKGNLKSLPEAAVDWREAFPVRESVPLLPVGPVHKIEIKAVRSKSSSDPLEDSIVCMDALNFTRSLQSQSVACVVTSPPYFHHRDYKVKGQIGKEKTYQEYVSRLTEIFAEVYRVLCKDGTFWLNLGDRFKDKHLLGIPWRVALALIDQGWILRSEIIWNKPVCLPESVKDRPSRVHETVFLFTKAKDYFYDADAIRVPYKDSTIPRMLRGVGDKHKNTEGAPGQNKHSLHQSRKHTGTGHGSDGKGLQGHSGYYKADGTLMINPLGRNKPSVWTVSTRALKEKHFAAFPPKLIEPMILAGSPSEGIVYDPFMGSGTTALVARQLGRHYIGCDLNPEYVEIANRRLAQPFIKRLL